MNKLNEMDIADLDKKELDELIKFERQINELHAGEELYILALKR